MYHVYNSNIYVQNVYPAMWILDMHFHISVLILYILQHYHLTTSEKNTISVKRLNVISGTH